MRIVSVDQSLTSSGVCARSGPYAFASRPLYSLLTWTPTIEVPGKRKGTTKQEKLVGMERLARIKTQLVDELARGCDILVIEGYAPRGTSDALLAGELGGMVKLTAHERGYTERNGKLRIIAPPTRIAFMNSVCGTSLSTSSDRKHGQGYLKREAVRLAKEFLGVTCDDDHQADAVWMAELVARGH